mmetsp:Transcript_27345/g.43918  ORF Transcript_27345/g.43918 Transcript_27345/m.43918 type:complete len:217 (-) Transcript_27345:693-1343(-)
MVANVILFQSNACFMSVSNSRTSSAGFASSKSPSSLSQSSLESSSSPSSSFMCIPPVPSSCFSKSRVALAMGAFRGPTSKLELAVGPRAPAACIGATWCGPWRGATRATCAATNSFAAVSFTGRTLLRAACMCEDGDCQLDMYGLWSFVTAGGSFAWAGFFVYESCRWSDMGLSCAAFLDRVCCPSLTCARCDELSSMLWSCESSKLSLDSPVYHR